MNQRDIWVIKSGTRWFVTQQGAAGRLGDYASEEEAITRGREMAAFLGSDLVIKRETGEWQRERRRSPRTRPDPKH